MAVTAERVTVGTSAVALNAAVTSGLQLTIKNGATEIDLGPSDVVSGAGYALAVDETVQIELDSNDVLFGITGTGTSDVQILRT